MSNPESPLARAIRVAVGRTGYARVVPNVTGLFRRPYDESRVRCGLGTGGADLVGVVMVDVVICRILGARKFGRVFCLEVKTPRGKTSPQRRKHQAAWRATVRRWGGFACVVRSVDEALAAVERARRGESE